MKKLKLNLQQFEGAEVLTRSQLKKVLGGDVGSGDETCNCNSKDDWC
jgi:natural product precursor